MFEAGTPRPRTNFELFWTLLQVASVSHQKTTKLRIQVHEFYDMLLLFVILT